MSFPNQPWQEEQDAPRWRPVAGKPNTYIHDECPCCEVEITKVECVDCGTHLVTHMHRMACHDNTKGHEVATNREEHERMAVTPHICKVRDATRRGVST